MEGQGVFPAACSANQTSPLVVSLEVWEETSVQVFMQDNIQENTGVDPLQSYMIINLIMMMSRILLLIEYLRGMGHLYLK